MFLTEKDMRELSQSSYNKVTEEYEKLTQNEDLNIIEMTDIKENELDDDKYFDKWQIDTIENGVYKKDIFYNERYKQAVIRLVKERKINPNKTYILVKRRRNRAQANYQRMYEKARYS